MHHPTSDWASRYGLPDPGPIADELLRLAPTELTDGYHCAGRLVRRIEDAAASMDRVRAVLATAWSNPSPASALLALSEAARYAVGVLSTAADAAIRAGQALATAQASVRAAYAWADEVIVRHDLVHPDSPIVLLAAVGGAEDPRRAARLALVTELRARVTHAQHEAAAAVAQLHGVLVEDPRDRLLALRSATGALPSRQPGSAVWIDHDNRAVMSADLTSGDPVRAHFAAGVLAALDHAAASAPPGTAVQLLAYDPRRPGGQGGAAIGIGDLSAADDVAVVVPGVGNSPAAMDGAVDAAAQIRTAGETADPSAAVAAIAWLGYDIPLSWPHDLPSGPMPVLADTLLALDSTDAVDGGARLTAFTTALRVAMSPSARLTLVGHSYGSVVVSAAATHGCDVDDIVLLAAPGAGPGIHAADQYAAVAPDHVFALSFDRDPVTDPITDVLTAIVVPASTRLPGSTFGDDPAASDFGAQVIDAPSNIPVVHLGSAVGAFGGPPAALLTDAMASVDQHPLTNYLGGAAGLAVGAVVVGRYTAVKTKKGR